MDLDSLNLEVVNKIAKDIEAELDIKLLKLGRQTLSLSKMQSTQVSNSATSQCEQLADEAELLLGKLAASLDNLARRREEVLGPESGGLASLQRHREIEAEYRKELRKCQQTISHAKETFSAYNRPAASEWTGGPGGYAAFESQRIESAQGATHTIIE